MTKKLKLNDGWDKDYFKEFFETFNPNNEKIEKIEFSKKSQPPEDIFADKFITIALKVFFKEFFKTVSPNNKKRIEKIEFKNKSQPQDIFADPEFKAECKLSILLDHTNLDKEIKKAKELELEGENIQSKDRGNISRWMGKMDAQNNTLISIYNQLQEIKELRNLSNNQ
tara:strand:+ start:128 stop:634 length:507 start_codon:yes stop_codon:yes gene_type:complete